VNGINGTGREAEIMALIATLDDASACPRLVRAIKARRRRIVDGRFPLGTRVRFPILKGDIVGTVVLPCNAQGLIMIREDSDRNGMLGSLWPRDPDRDRVETIP
jgi:hypothetical protein